MSEPNETPDVTEETMWPKRVLARCPECYYTYYAITWGQIACCPKCGSLFTRDNHRVEDEWYDPAELERNSSTNDPKERY